MRKGKQTPIVGKEKIGCEGGVKFWNLFLAMSIISAFDQLFLFSAIK